MDAEEIEYYTSNICRLCLSDTKLKTSIFGDIGQEKQAFFKIQCCLPNIQVTKNDGFPEHICYKCLSSLENFYTFWSQCCSSDSILSCRLPKRQRKQLLPSSPVSQMGDITYESDSEDDWDNCIIRHGIKPKKISPARITSRTVAFSTQDRTVVHTTTTVSPQKQNPQVSQVNNDMGFEKETPVQSKSSDEALEDRCFLSDFWKRNTQEDPKSQMLVCTGKNNLEKSYNSSSSKKNHDVTVREPRSHLNTIKQTEQIKIQDNKPLMGKKIDLYNSDDSDSNFNNQQNKNKILRTSNNLQQKNASSLMEVEKAKQNQYLSSKSPKPNSKRSTTQDTLLTQSHSSNREFEESILSQFKNESKQYNTRDSYGERTYSRPLSSTTQSSSDSFANSDGSYYSNDKLASARKLLQRFRDFNNTF